MIATSSPSSFVIESVLSYLPGFAQACHPASPPARRSPRAWPALRVPPVSQRGRSARRHDVGGVEVLARRGYRRGQLADVACAMNVSVLGIGPVVVALGGCRCGSFFAISIVNSSTSMTDAADLLRGRFGDEQISALEGAAEDGSRMALRSRLCSSPGPRRRSECRTELALLISCARSEDFRFLPAS